jgi:hypothetical protein
MSGSKRSRKACRCGMETVTRPDELGSELAAHDTSLAEQARALGSRFPGSGEAPVPATASRTRRREVRVSELASAPAFPIIAPASSALSG